MSLCIYKIRLVLDNQIIKSLNLPFLVKAVFKENICHKHYQITFICLAHRINNYVCPQCFENLKKMHEEIQTCVTEIDKTKKLYFEEEHMAHDARDKAHDADEK